MVDYPSLQHSHRNNINYEGKNFSLHDYVLYDSLFRDDRGKKKSVIFLNEP